MCGIGGLMLFPKNRDGAELNFIRLLAEGIMIENEARGNHSAGMVTFSEKGYSLIKEPISATNLAKTSDFRHFLNHEINNETKNILIHTRLATKGDKQINDNNHPIDTYSCVGVHNGMIYNDDELFKEYDLFRQAEVDSEVIFRLVDAQGKRINTNKVKKVAEALSGSFAFAFVRKNEAHRMHIVRNDNPITFMYIPQINAIAFASQKKFLIDALSEANFQSVYGAYITEQDCFFVEPTRTSIYEFDTSKDNGAEQLFQDPTAFKEADDYYYSNKYYSRAYGWDWWDEDGYVVEKPSSGKKKSNSSILTLLEEVLDEDQIEELEDAIEMIRSKAWSEGFSDGRVSMAEQLEKIGRKYIS